MQAPCLRFAQLQIIGGQDSLPSCLQHIYNVQQRPAMSYRIEPCPHRYYKINDGERQPLVCSCSLSTWLSKAWRLNSTGKLGLAGWHSCIQAGGWLRRVEGWRGSSVSFAAQACADLAVLISDGSR